MMSSCRTFGFATMSAVLLLSSCLSDGRDLQPPTENQIAGFTSVTTVPPVADDGADQSTAMTVTAPWQNGTAVPVRYTCAGEGVSPPLIWTPGPPDTKAYGIVLRDNDAPDFHHWVVTNISADVKTLTENSVPPGAFVALNSSKKQSYGAPCPPKGSTHSYTLTIYALSSPVTITPPALAQDVIAEMEAVVLEVATTDFVFAR